MDVIVLVSNSEVARHCDALRGEVAETCPPFGMIKTERPHVWIEVQGNQRIRPDGHTLQVSHGSRVSDSARLKNRARRGWRRHSCRVRDNRCASDEVVEVCTTHIRGGMRTVSHQSGHPFIKSMVCRSNADEVSEAAAFQDLCLCRDSNHVEHARERRNL